jgi:hypothetical protein
MPTQPSQPANFSAGGILGSIGKPSSLNWRTHLIFAVLAFLSAFTFDFPRLGGGWQNWALIAIAGFVATVLTIEILTLVVAKRSWKKPRVTPVLILLTAAGLIRGLVIATVGGWLEIVPSSELLFRLIGAPVYVVCAYLISNTLVSSRLEYREFFNRLTAETELLDSTSTGFEKEITRLQTELKLGIQVQIAPAVWELKKHISNAKLSKDVSGTISELRRLSESIIRPLSRSLSNRPELNRQSAGLVKARFGQFNIPKKVYLGRSVPVGLILLLTIVLGFSSRAVEADPIQALLVTLVFSGLLGIELWVFVRLTKNTELPVLLALAVATGYAALMGLSTALLVPLEIWDLEPIFVAQSVAFMTTNVFLNFTLAVFQSQRGQALLDLAGVVEQLRIVNAQLRQQTWLYQKMLAGQLHGPIQAVLQAAAFRLARPETHTPAALEEVLAEVNKVVATIGEFDYLEGRSIEQGLTDLVEVWDGVCQIDLDFDHELLRELADDSILGRCFLEVLQEAITNAIKHGKANVINASGQLDADWVELLVRNNGSEVASFTQGQVPGYLQGYGTRVIQELTLSSSLISSAGETVFQAQIPLTR